LDTPGSGGKQKHFHGRPSSELYTGEDEEEAAEAVAVNLVGTVSRPMLTKSMLAELRRAYNADKNTRKDFGNPEHGKFEKAVDG
jgi:hypothetical protein